MSMLSSVPCHSIVVGSSFFVDRAGWIKIVDGFSSETLGGYSFSSIFIERTFARRPLPTRISRTHHHNFFSFLFAKLNGYRVQGMRAFSPKLNEIYFSK